MPTPSYDAIIIGSGITGGWAAKELTEKGLSTLILEAGRPITPEKDYVEHLPVWELKYRNWDQREERAKTQYVQRECYYACDEFSNKFFVKDSENPYKSDPGKHFSWIRGRQVGGKSITWGRQSYRWSDLDFEAIQENTFPGFVDAKWAANPSPGAARAIAGATWTSKPTYRTA
jgi:choline dehydrogenase-like flavoprotein